MESPAEQLAYANVSCSGIRLTRSRLKAQTCLEALAIVVTVEKKSKTTSKLPSTHVAAKDPVALKMTWMMGKLVASGPMMSWRFVMQKQKVMVIVMPIIPFAKVAQLLSSVYLPG